MQNKSQKDKAIKPVDQTDEIRAAIDYGIDISMLMDNIKRTPTERIRRHRMALDSVIKMQKAAKNDR